MRSIMRNGLLISLMALLAYPLSAAHIIGGEISYRCLGGNQYQFTLKIYRDCAGGGADFDGAANAPFPAEITVYQGSSSVPYQILELGTPSIQPLDPEISNPCLIIPPNICVEEGTYVWNMTLPFTGESYHITYQRCCRNNTITNIVAPGETGATYTMELTAAAQSNCNNSPEFNKVPPIVICAGQPIDFDFSAMDEDGDELVYSLCHPLTGGGNDTNQPFLPTGVSPSPDLPPPYNPVVFISPYSVNNPLNGNPSLSIDPNTGFITGVPVNLGQYVVGVCVEEYRNGTLLSTTRRDFQFNVATCEPTVVADVAEDLFIDGTFRVISCGDNTVTIINESYQEQFLNEVFWEFEINGTTQTVTTFDATVEFPAEGTYYGQLFVNPGTTCADTADIEVNIFPEVISDFGFEYDTCIAGLVEFEDQSYSGAGPNTIIDWNWDFGDGEQRNDQNPEHLYVVPGVLPVTLTVTDVNGCEDEQTINVNYYPVPAEVLLAPSDLVLCEPGTVLFDNLSFPIDSTYNIEWDFGDGSFGEGISPVHTYQDPGIYTVYIQITSPIGCYTDTVFPNLLEILPSPEAGFDYNPKELNNFSPVAYFTDQSIDAVSWRWEFGDLAVSTDQNPVFTFPDTGFVDVLQVVTHQSGCKDTASIRLDIEPQVRYFLPNAFSPNGDGTNDIFRGEGVMEGAQNFNFRIWNRYGELIFETGDPYESWNGRKFNTGEPAPSGVYLVTVSYIEPRGRPVKLNGYATLLR